MKWLLVGAAAAVIGYMVLSKGGGVAQLGLPAQPRSGAPPAQNPAQFQQGQVTVVGGVNANQLLTDAKGTINALKDLGNAAQDWGFFGSDDDDPGPAAMTPLPARNYGVGIMPVGATWT